MVPFVHANGVDRVEVVCPEGIRRSDATAVFELAVESNGGGHYSPNYCIPSMDFAGMQEYAAFVQAVTLIAREFGVVVREEARPHRKRVAGSLLPEPVVVFGNATIGMLERLREAIKILQAKAAAVRPRMQELAARLEGVARSFHEVAQKLLDKYREVMTQCIAISREEVSIFLTEVVEPLSEAVERCLSEIR